MFYLGIFLLGAIFGSFSNVCIYRLPNNKAISKGRSYCNSCNKEIRWIDNIPLISYIILRGKCRSCNAKINFQYALVEFLSGISFVFIYYVFGLSITSVLLTILSILVKKEMNTN